ncbi:hypothetical protein [Streptomyces sp. NPDC005970]|uniref:hypothetical protein n=1 Tax=Streptomyces sp. NPDC005970 TaxID=3156723 RepID=UPI003409AB9D
MPVDGPHRIYVDPIPGGASLDVEAFVQHVVHDVIELLLTEKYGDRFDALGDMQARDPHLIELPGNLPFESLVADLIGDINTKMPVYGGQVLRLAERLRELGEPKAVPGQRGAA